ncbi:MAG: molybdopterin synthase catalytic subunit MoaE [Gammaproteobacteria bacterium]|nr:molybdopterin synthase catalytic subunit MoaE [Gammaproteobacteria bacterium]MBU1653680.1 molybdopterin synthase catalytic subunit MoaE [Gammaproteobacteria bacterium]MBU1962510.1 molybdopterin synthase catalytic subunit MoaE [Gammaproteobacteria bacterium]
MKEIAVIETPLDPEAEQLSFRRGRPSSGAVVAFVGLMRDINEGASVSAMFLEHYPGMTEKALKKIVAEAKSRWAIDAVRVVHRVGELRPEDPIVLVAVASRHRGDAFRACEFVIDFLKTRAPFWKREQTDAGAHWVDARESDEAAQARWHSPS